MNTERATHLTQGLDYYKATMSQLEFEHHPLVDVRFELKNRATNALSDYVSPTELQERLTFLQQTGWQPEEIAYLASLQNQDGTAQFSREYLDFLANHRLPDVEVCLNDQDEIAVHTHGFWPLVTFWETIVMSELNELYFSNKLAAEQGSLQDLYAEGDRRLDEKIALLKTRPDILFADFGTRRRFSYAWHKHVIERLANEVPQNFVGTSNIYLAHTLNLRPIGTYAHELPMVYGALADRRGDNPLTGHTAMLQDWQATYRGDLSIALTDTFTSDFFFADFSREQADAWKGLRHDSGDPIAFGEKVITFYQAHDIDPRTKTIVFSDGLDLSTIVALADHFTGRINVMFGWGTTLTNDLGVEVNNIVMKAVEANGVTTVKLSDAQGKYTGDQEKISHYKALVSTHLESHSIRVAKEPVMTV